MADFWNSSISLVDPLDKSKFVTTTTDGAKIGLDVNVINTADFDVRDLTLARDSVNSHPIESDGTSLILDVGGTKGIKNHIVGMPDVFAEGTVAVGASLSGHYPVTIGYSDGSGNNIFASAAAPLPVTGTVTANLSATDNAVLDDIADGIPDTSTPSTPYHLVSAATTNATNVKNAAGVVHGIYASNVNAAARYLKMYNKASAPTVGTDTPVHTFIIPGNTAGAGTNIPIPQRGINFTTGISFALTTEATDAGTTAVAANEIVVNLDYI